MSLGTTFLKCKLICGFAKLCSFSLLTNSYLTCDYFGAPGKGQVYHRWESLITTCAFHMLSFGTWEHHIVTGCQIWSGNTFQRMPENISYMPVYLKIFENSCIFSLSYFCLFLLMDKIKLRVTKLELSYHTWEQVTGHRLDTWWHVQA